MVQDQASGAAANRWGHQTARKIAKRIGATMVTSTSNEAILGTKHVVIKCAARRTVNLGVTFKMLARLDIIVAALQLDDGSFELRSLPVRVFRAQMRSTRSKGSAGRVGQVARAAFCNRGTLIRRVRINPQRKASR